MQASLEVLRSTQLGRAESQPLARAPLPAYPAELVLENVRQRNAVLDWLFYDVGVVSTSEARSIAPWLAAEGAMLVVPPTGRGELQQCRTIDELVNGFADVTHTLAVAGVGSSALGAAAFARNIADAIGEPVIAVVSGYGLGDLAAEALGGFYLFGAANWVRHQFEWLDRLRESGFIADPSTSSAGAATGSPLSRSKDARTVQALLSHDGLALNRMVGHSKGNLVISEALYALQATDPERLKSLAKQVHLVTISAKIAMPPAFERITDVMGQLDGFGALNSRPDLGTEVSVPMAWHHTNTQLPFSLPVCRTLEALLAAG